MSKGYLIFTEAIKDAEAMNGYTAKAMPTLMAAGGRVIIVDGAPDVKEGTWHGTQTVVLEFDSVDAANAWYNSPAYQESIPLRQAAAECNVAVLSGFDMPGA